MELPVARCEYRVPFSGLRRYTDEAALFLGVRV